MGDIKIKLHNLSEHDRLRIVDKKVRLIDGIMHLCRHIGIEEPSGVSVAAIGRVRLLWDTSLSAKLSIFKETVSEYMWLNDIVPIYQSTDI